MASKVLWENRWLQKYCERIDGSKSTVREEMAPKVVREEMAPKVLWENRWLQKYCERRDGSKSTVREEMAPKVLWEKRWLQKYSAGSQEAGVWVAF